MILSLDSGSRNGTPMLGGTGAADAAMDALIRQLAQELGPSGVRALGIWTAGVADTLTPEKLAGAAHRPWTRRRCRGYSRTSTACA